MTRTLLCALLAINAAPVWAQESSQQLAALDNQVGAPAGSDTIVVTGQRQTPADENVKLGVFGKKALIETPFAVTVLDRNIIATSRRSSFRTS